MDTRLKSSKQTKIHIIYSYHPINQQDVPSCIVENGVASDQTNQANLSPESSTRPEFVLPNSSTAVRKREQKTRSAINTFRD